MEVAQRTDRAVVFRTKMLGAADGRPVTFAIARRTGMEIVSKSAGEAEASTISALDALDNGLDQLRDMVAGHRIKPDALRAHRAQLESDLRNHLTLTRTLLQQDRKKTAERRQQILNPPPIGNNLAQALIDNETRAQVRSLDDKQREKLFEAIGKGQHRDVLDSLARDPVPFTTIAYRSRQIYEAFVKQEYAEQLKLLDMEDEGAAVVEANINAAQELAKV